MENELDRLDKLDIIERVDGPTPWVSPIVVVPKKSGDVRICVDTREANKAVQRIKHVMPTIDELITDLNGACVFSTLDLKSAYHQLELNPESRYITTFTTHVGLWRYKRLMFGINAASEIFQNTLSELLSGLDGCKNMSDDIIVYGKTQQEHDKCLKPVLGRLRQKNVKLNKDKCMFSQNHVCFYGHIFSADGIAADPNKTSAIVNAAAPQNASEVRSLLGMAQYVSRFIPAYAEITAELRELTHKDVPWTWKREHQQALDNLKTKLTSVCTVQYFDPTKLSKVLVDASPVGIGAILCQDDKVVCYASRALSAVEQRYSQTEREMLAVVWGAERFHLYLYGAQFEIISDHKPLLGIFASHKQASARMERWRLRLSPYSYSLLYRPGRDNENPADYLSRHPDQPASTDPVENTVSYICTSSVPKAMTLQEVEQHYLHDPVMQKLSHAIQSGQWTDEEVTPYLRIQDELAVYRGIVLRHTRIVLPFSLRERAVELAHRGHQGVVKTKSLLREKVWFPGIDAMVEERVKACIPCQATSTHGSEHCTPLKMSHLPDRPWKELSIDFIGPFPTGESLLVVMDDYSRFPEVEIVHPTSSNTVIPKLDAIFARQGIPSELRSDNGPPFNGGEFASFASYLGFKHRRITPLWPGANGEVERLMKTLGKAIRAAFIDQRNWKQELYTFLRQYRATPHSTTGVSPSELLNGRPMKIMLPELRQETQPMGTIDNRDALEKSKMKRNADDRRGAKDSKLSVGDIVLVRQPHKNKLSAPFDSRPLKITARKGNMVTARRGRYTITRNIAHFKSVPLVAFRDGVDDQRENDDDQRENDDDQPVNDNDQPVNDNDQPVNDDVQPRPMRRATIPLRFRDFVMHV